jgi:segregation and condensation protein B
MTEHEASAVAEQAPTQSGTEAELIGSPDLILDVAVVVAMDAAPKRRSKKSSNSESPEGDHPSLFAINLDDPELPSATMPFTLRVEAAILLADRPISDARIAEVLGLVPPSVRTGKADGAKTEAKTEARADQGSDESSDNDPSGRDSAAIAGRRREAARVVREAVDALNQQYAATNRAFRVESVAGGRQMLTIAAFGPVLARIKGQRAQTRLSQAALETLAIIAYRQPMLRAQLEAIRGVACGEVLRSLMERRLVKIVGRAEEVGRPMLYGTTPEFLRVFGIATLSDLPQAKDLR